MILALLPGSDSSMDDCNLISGNANPTALRCSDSSMDDCNPKIRISGPNSLLVQIPLWTIVTGDGHEFGQGQKARSDSSMDDCNRRVAAERIHRGQRFRFLYGRL